MYGMCPYNTGSFNAQKPTPGWFNVDPVNPAMEINTEITEMPPPGRFGVKPRRPKTKPVEDPWKEFLSPKAKDLRLQILHKGQMKAFRKDRDRQLRNGVRRRNHRIRRSRPFRYVAPRETLASIASCISKKSMEYVYDLVKEAGRHFAKRTWERAWGMEEAIEEADDAADGVSVSGDTEYFSAASQFSADEEDVVSMHGERMESVQATPPVVPFEQVVRNVFPGPVRRPDPPPTVADVYSHDSMQQDNDEASATEIHRRKRCRFF